MTYCIGRRTCHVSHSHTQSHTVMQDHKSVYLSSVCLSVCLSHSHCDCCFLSLSDLPQYLSKGFREKLLLLLSINERSKKKRKKAYIPKRAGYDITLQIQQNLLLHQQITYSLWCMTGHKLALHKGHPKRKEGDKIKSDFKFICYNKIRTLCCTSP